MTRIILHGGYTGIWDDADRDLPLFRKLIDAARASDNKIMIGFLAYETPADFPRLDGLLAYFRELDPTVTISVAGRDNFRELLPQHKILFLQGGNSRGHHQALSDVTKEELIQGKELIAGSSSGAMMLSHYGYSRSSGGPLHGKGVVDVMVIPHADAFSTAEGVAELHKLTPLPIILLDENRMVELSIK